MTAKRKQHGMVLMDLLLGLMIGAIVLAAAATMADAMSHGKRATENMTRTSSYLAQLHTRLADLIMRADEIMPDDEYNNGVKLTYSNGITVRIYSDDSRTVTVKENGKSDTVYDYKKEDKITQEPVSLQDNVEITYDGVNRVTITFDIEGVSYTMTAARRGRG